jgi:microsomal dipeptidase-like Zn-dependent dipeptidase
MRTAAVIALALVAIAWTLLAANFERFVNRVETTRLPEVSSRALALHRASAVVDLHADSLLSGRDLTRRASIGHTDLPRLREGNVMLQVFGVATSVPAGMNIERNERPGFDLIALGFCIRLSPGCVGGPPARFDAMTVRLAKLVERDDALVWVRTASDLERLRARHEQDPRALGALLAIEGAHALAGDNGTLEAAFVEGVRMIGLAHFFDNEYAGSAHGALKGGLTEIGRRTVARMEQLGIAVDLAHLSPAAIDDVLAIAHKPVVVSHGGAKGTCDNARTLSDAQLRGVAATGGVVGIGYWREAVCGTAPSDVARAIRYVVDLIGDDHVALGSDYDGGTTVSFDASQLAVLTQAMLDAGLSDASVRKVLGENALRVLAAILPRD